MIDAVLLDVDGVVIRPDQHWGDGLQQDLGLDYATLQRAFFAIHWEDVVCGRATLRERLGPVLATIAPALALDRLLAYWFAKDAQLDPVLLGEVALLRSAGLRVCLATNQEHERTDYIMRVLGLAAHVEACHHSASIGYRKPDPLFFRCIGARLGLPPNRMLLIDDSEPNVMAARQEGWRALVWREGSSLTELVRHATTARG